MLPTLKNNPATFYLGLCKKFAAISANDALGVLANCFIIWPKRHLSIIRATINCLRGGSSFIHIAQRTRMWLFLGCSREPSGYSCRIHGCLMDVEGELCVFGFILQPRGVCCLHRLLSFPPPPRGSPSVT